MGQRVRVGDDHFYFVSAETDEGYDPIVQGCNRHLLDFVIHANAGYTLVRDPVHINKDQAKILAIFILDEIRKHEEQDIPF